MPDQTTDQETPATTEPESQSTTATKTLPAPSKPRQLPPWKVLLHNDDVNAFDYVIETVAMLTPLNRGDAVQRTLEAHLKGVTLLLTTHKERAELYKDQFTSRRLTVTIEAGD